MRAHVEAANRNYLTLLHLLITILLDLAAEGHFVTPKSNMRHCCLSTSLYRHLQIDKYYNVLSKQRLLFVCAPLNLHTSFIYGSL